jgi:glyoxylase-like metal-dependent hydrolase (beta-lactamase superfamily II)
MDRLSLPAAPIVLDSVAVHDIHSERFKMIHMRKTVTLSLLVCLPALATFASSQAAGKGELSQISDNLFVFEDTCKVYAVKSGDEAILIDFGTGEILNHLSAAGIRKVAWVLHTNYLRPKCQGDSMLAGKGIQLLVPAPQRTYFEDAAGHWDSLEFMHIYYFKPGVFIPARNVKVDKALAPGEDFEWKGLRFSTLPNVGPTETPGLTYIAEIDGQRAAFTGDLIHSPGKIQNYYDLQWFYNAQIGAQRSIESLQEIKNAAPDLLLPSHGAVMDEPAAAIGKTIESLINVIETVSVTRQASDPNGGNQIDWKTVLPHVYHENTTYFIVADDGHAMVYDTEFRGQGLTRLLDKMRSERGLKQVDIVSLSHYHDDHVDGIPEMLEQTGAQLWVHERLADILQNPYRYNAACLGGVSAPPAPGPPVDRVLREGESFEWKGWKFSVYHFPGQTEYHQAMLAEIDGKRVLFIGDSTYAPTPGAIFRGENFNCLNECRLGPGVGYRKCGELLQELKPDAALAAHFGYIPLDSKRIQEYVDWSEQLESAFKNLIARDNPNFGTDPNWLTFYPFRVFADSGQTIQTELRVRNYSARRATAEIRIVAPEGWSAAPPGATIEVAAGQAGAAEFTLTAPKGDPLPFRSILTADVVFDGVDYGQHPVMVIDSRADWEADRSKQPAVKYPARGSRQYP